MKRARTSPRDPHAHAVHAPGPRLLRRVPLQFVARLLGGEGRRGVSASLNLVSFIDFLVVTVIFLLMSFSASGQCPGPNIHIPSAANGAEVVDAPMVSVRGDQILVDGVSAGSTRAVAELGHMEKIPELLGLLSAKRALWQSVEPRRKFPGVCVLQIDQDVPAVVVKSVFTTAAAAGYPSVSFLVHKIGG